MVGPGARKRVKRPGSRKGGARPLRSGSGVMSERTAVAVHPSFRATDSFVAGTETQV